MCCNRDGMVRLGRVSLPAGAAKAIGSLSGKDDGAGRSSACAHTFAQGDEVRPGLAVLELEPAADPAEAGHRLICDPVGTGFLRECGHLVLVLRRVIDAALAVIEQYRGAVRPLGPGADHPLSARRWICLPGDPGSSGRGKLMDSR